MLGLALAILSGPAAAAPESSESDGWWRDGLGDRVGVDFAQNVNVGPDLLPGVRVSLGRWSWVQSYSTAANTVSEPFSSGRGVLRQAQVDRDGCPTCYWESVGLTRRVYRFASDLTQSPGLSTTTIVYNGTYAGIPWVVAPDLSALAGPTVVHGPFATDLVPGLDYTATFQSAWCDDPTCANGSAVTGAEAVRFAAAYGKTEYSTNPLRLGAYPSQDWAGEGQPSPLTVEIAVPNPLPLGNGWEFRVIPTMTWSGSPVSPPCAPNCTATLWLDTVEVMARGHPIPYRATPLDASSTWFDCGPGFRECNGTCYSDATPCGWDAATYFVGSGTYLSPVFDSLSDQTVWTDLFWNVDQNFMGSPNGWPRTPVFTAWCRAA